MATLSIPSPELNSAKFATDKHGLRRPLSTHGLPKEPRSMSPGRLQQFSALGLSSPTIPASPRSPRSPGPMSPPMSAKSFGTFIDSEPSTPAYSPRMDHGWDSSTLVLLRPTSSSSEPSSPTEPGWDMMVPLKVPARNPPLMNRPKEAIIPSREIIAPAKQMKAVNKEIHSTTPLPSHPTKKIKPGHRPKDIKIVDVQSREHVPPKKVEIDEPQDIKSPGAQSSVTSPAAFGKLASKMKLMLRRRSTGEKKKPKKEKEPMEVDRLEDVHWTEM